MFIGEVSKRTGLSIKAIRFYEEKGLIRAPKRQGRYRVYDSADVEVLLLIAEAKQLGVTLNRLKNVIVYRHGVIDWQRINGFLKEVRSELETEMSRLAGNLERVNACINSIDDCPQPLDSPPKGRA